jgi:tetratricopeptide (TPR) repeat protein
VPTVQQVTAYYVPTPVVILPPALPSLIDPGELMPALPALPALPRLPGEEAGGFRPVRPEDRARAQQPAPPAPPPAEKAPPRQPPREPPVPVPAPEADLRAENAHQVLLGRQAVAAREYGRAELRFRDAVAALPDDPVTYFLLAQARFALGKYREAIEAIAAGLRLRPDWPAARFRPLELYEGNVADYAEHMHRLAEALARRPDDPVLLFLSAYELWFDGRKAEATALFERAAALGAFQPLVERFLLHAGAGGPFI